MNFLSAIPSENHIVRLLAKSTFLRTILAQPSDDHLADRGVLRDRIWTHYETALLNKYRDERITRNDRPVTDPPF
jgi:hypothetical protein